jgi:hypothetical protein
MIIVSLIVVTGYFAFWGYTYLLVTKVEKALHKHFPKEADQYFGTKKLFGISKGRGLLFLWDTEIRKLTSGNKSVERLRHRAAISIGFLLGGLFALPVIIMLIWWVM